MNITNIIGNLGHDAEVRDTASGPMVTFSAADNNMIRGEEIVEWCDCVWFGQYAGKASERLTKGARVALWGTSYPHEHNGKTYRKMKVDKVVFLDKREDRPDAGFPPQSGYVENNDSLTNPDPADWAGFSEENNAAPEDPEGIGK
jgi:single-stranded DNA-binding protein